MIEDGCHILFWFVVCETHLRTRCKQRRETKGNAVVTFGFAEKRLAVAEAVRVVPGHTIFAPLRTN
jgi:hypothetical protein